MRLTDLIPALHPRRVVLRRDVDVSVVVRDTRELPEDGVFVAIRGATIDGHDLVSALRCAAVVVEREVEVHPDTSCIEVADTRIALAHAAAELHGQPSLALPVIGVTGTNGKTTITTLVQQALDALAYPCGRIGTLGTAFATHAFPTSHTTPEAPVLLGQLAEMRRLGARAVAVEVSSIGLAQHRVDGVRFHLALFTNLTHDHLDFHGDMETYAAAKARLFTELLRPAGGAPRALVCADDAAATRLGAPADTWTYGFAQGADLRIVDIDAGPEGSRITVTTPVGTATLHSLLLGRHNAQNLVAALGVALILGHPLDAAAAAVGAAPGAPGRLSRVPDPAGRLVLVDYAHSPDALEHALRTLRPLTLGALWVVFGCGGNRDAAKRARMGSIASAHADRVVITSDNPRSEDPAVIAAAILGGVHDPRKAHLELDRRAAIHLAVRQTGAGDTVLIAGKGHEAWQETATGRIPFDDHVEAALALGRAP